MTSMIEDLTTPEVRFGLEAAERCGRLSREIQESLAEPALQKRDRSPVTVADFAVQALVGWLAEEHGIRDPLVAEEDTALLESESGMHTLELVCTFLRSAGLPASRDSVLGWIERGSGTTRDRFWTLDPIDGTKGFLRNDQFAFALALIEGGRVKLGMLSCPRLPQAERDETGTIFLAARGQGSWVRPLDTPGDFQRLHVSAVSDPVQARLVRSVERDHTDSRLFEKILHALGSTRDPVFMDSQAKYAVLSSGRAELLLRLISPSRPDYQEKIWDQAAGSLVVEEAGGKVTDLDGKRLDFSQGETLAANRGVVASNGHLHDVALEAIRQVERHPSS